MIGTIAIVELTSGTGRATSTRQMTSFKPEGFETNVGVALFIADVHLRSDHVKVTQGLVTGHLGDTVA